MNYKKPGFWIMAVAIVVCIAVAVCFLTDPPMEMLRVLPEVHSHSYGVVEVTYESRNDKVPDMNKIIGLRFRIGERMELGIKSDAVSYTKWIDLGTFTEIKLTKDNFDRICYHENGWVKGESAAGIRRNTAHAWELVLEKTEQLFYLIQMKNGELFLAEGYYDSAEKEDPGSDDTSVNLIYRLAVNLNEDYNIIAKSGENIASVTIFPANTPIKDYKTAIHWLTIDPGDDLSPFRVYQNGGKITGYYLCADAKTYETVPYLVPSGLDPQTYLFQNCDPNRDYIVVMKPSTEPDAPVYTFGVRFAQEPAQPIAVEYYLTVGEEGVHQILVSADGQEEIMYKEDGTPYQKGDRLLLNLLTGNTLLNGMQLKALDADGNQIWNFAIYANQYGKLEKELIVGEWIITPVLFGSGEVEMIPTVSLNEGIFDRYL